MQGFPGAGVSLCRGGLFSFIPLDVVAKHRQLGGAGLPLSASLGGVRVLASCQLEHIILHPLLCRAEVVTGEWFPGHKASPWQGQAGAMSCVLLRFLPASTLCPALAPCLAWTPV